MGTTTPRPPVARVIAEPLTYAPDSPHSFFADQFRAKQLNDAEARERLDRHVEEMRVELRSRADRPVERRHRGDVIQPADVTFERRDPDATPGGGGYATPPLWLVDLTANAPRPERILGDLVPSFPLPRGVASVSIPRLTVGTSTGLQAPNQGASDTDIEDAASTSRVVLVNGQADVALALLEQSGRNGGHLDQVIWRDMLDSYDAELEAQLIAGDGGSPTDPTSQLNGLLNIDGTTPVAYTSASPTAIEAYPLVGQTLGAVADNRKRKPTAVLMRFGRWVWFSTSEDEEGRPLGVPDAHNAAPVTPDGVPDPIGSLVNVPVFEAETIPSNLGAGTDQDAIIACRPQDMLLWETSTPIVSVFDEVLSDTLEARIQLRKYVAFIGDRWPSGIAILGGTGLTVPTNE